MWFTTRTIIFHLSSPSMQLSPPICMIFLSLSMMAEPEQLSGTEGPSVRRKTTPSSDTDRRCTILVFGNPPITKRMAIPETTTILNKYWNSNIWTLYNKKDNPFLTKQVSQIMRINPNSHPKRVDNSGSTTTVLFCFKHILLFTK